MSDSGRDPDLHMTPAQSDYDQSIEPVLRQFRTLGESDKDAANLVQAIETEILPRLLLLHREPRADRESGQILTISDEVLERFSTFIVNGPMSEARRLVEQLQNSGTSTDELILKLFASSAIRLGHLWERDQADFSEVTIGLCRLQELLRNYSVVGDYKFRTPLADDPSILLASACGDQHIFGLLIVAEMFRRDGWKTICEPSLTVSDIAKLAGDEAFSVVGLSLARHVEAAELKREIDLIRGNSANQDVKILLGGALLQSNHEIAEIVGADLILTDAGRAPHAARQMLADAKVCC